MPRLLAAVCLTLAVSAPSAAQQVDMELMTYPEIASSLRAGKTTVLIYNGGTEQRGPHAVVGGHTLIAKRVSVEIARQLGNALVAPVQPFALAGSHLNANWPGSVDLPAAAFTAVNEAVVDSMVINGFKHVVLMADHGGGQRELEELARRLDAKYKSKGVRVHFCGDVYEKTHDEVDAWIAEHHLPQSSHAGIPDTALLMYLGGDAYVRKDKLAAGDPVVARGQQPPSGSPQVNNGVRGDPRQATPEMGRIFFEMQVRNGVSQIRLLTK